MTPKELHEKNRKCLGLICCQLTNCVAHIEAAKTEVLGSQVPYMEPQQPHARAYLQFHSPHAEEGELGAKPQYSGGRERPWLCHRVIDWLGLVGMSGSLWLIPCSSSNTQSRVPSTRPYPGVFWRSPRRRLHSPHGQHMPVPPFHQTLQ